jgi:hypothetical protein
VVLNVKMRLRERLSSTRPVTRVDWLAVLAPAAFVVALAANIVLWGLPTEHAGFFAWLVGGLLAFSIRAWRRWPRLLLDWLPIVALLIVYDIARGHAGGDITSAHYHAQVDFDRFLTGGQLPTAWLQDRLHTPGTDPAPWDYAAWATYITHFFVPWVTLAVLWRTAHDRFRVLRDRLVALTIAGCTIYALYPAAPPWLAATPPVDRLIQPIWQHVGLKVAAPLFESGDSFVNVVAAVPSLHAAYPCLLLLVFWDRGRVARAVLGLYTLAMGFTLVYSGEHFVFDIFAGWSLAGAVVLAFRVVPWLGLAPTRRVRPEPQPQAGTAQP